MRARGPGAVAAAAVTASATAVMLVGHSIWQGWWIAMLGAAAVWIARLPDGRGDPTVPPPGRRARP